MELYKELLMSHAGGGGSGMLALYMGGTAPTTGEELKAAVDIYNFQDMYAKCLGISLLSMAGAGNASILSQVSGKIAMKKNAFDFALQARVSSVIPADMKKAPIPDRMFLCEVAAPKARAENMGVSSFWSNTIAPWLVYEDALLPTTYPIRSGRSELFDSGLTSVVEFEWDSPRNFGGVVRSSTYASYTGNYGLLVEAWNGTDWEVVRPLASVTQSTYPSLAAFTKRILTTRLRITVTYPRTAGAGGIPHGIIPLEVIADAPAPVAPADITWTILLPMFGRLFPVTAPMLTRLTDPSHPVPMYAGRVGGPGSGAPDVDIVLHKCADLTPDDLPSVSGVRIQSSNLME